MFVFFMTLTATPAAIKAGESCQLNHALAVEIKRGKKKKTEALAKGETLKVIDLGKKESTVEGKVGRGAVATSELTKYCVSLTKPAEPAPVVAEAPPPPPPPASAPVTEIFVPKKTTSVTIGALVMPPNTKREIYESVRKLMLDVIRTSGTLHHVDEQELSDKDALACVQSNKCLGERAKAVNAEYAVGAWLKSEKNRGVLDFRLVDANGKPGNATLRAINDPGEVDNETVTAMKIIFRGMIPEDAGTLTLNVNEPGAVIAIDGQTMGKAPLGTQKLRAGTHEVTLEKPRFITTNQKVVVDPGRDNFADVWIQPKPDYLAEYRQRNGMLRKLAWTGVGVGIAGTVATFALRVAANRVEDGLKNDYARLDAMYAGLPADQVPRAEYEAVDKRAGTLPLLDGLTYAAGALAIIGAATAITCFVIGDDPKRYDNKPASTDVRLSVGFGLGSLRLAGEF